MKVKYTVVTLYEGHCPICGDYVCSQISSKGVDDECSSCKLKKVMESIINKEITITDISGNFISGYYITVKTKDKTFIIEANKLYEVLNS